MTKAFLFLPVLVLLLAANVQAQTTEAPFIKLVDPLKETSNVSVSRNFIIGSTCKTCSLQINEQAVKVYPTGAFAFEINLKPGDSLFTLTASPAKGKSITKKINFFYTIPKPAEPVTTVDIASIQTFPAGNLVLLPGDIIRFKVKALPNSNLSTLNNSLLYEMPLSQTAGMPGIYQGEYVIKATDSFTSRKFPVTLMSKDGQRITKETGNSFSVMSPLSSDIALTKGRLAFLEYGLGEDRLGGAKIGYLDSMIPLKIIGKIGNDYKVRLAKTRTAYIPDDLVTLMPKGSFTPEALSGAWRVSGDSVYDYLTIGLSSKLPYQSAQLINPSRITVDIFGATSNTNWITQLKSAKEIENVDYEQVADDIVRITIQLKHSQHWGHQIYYRGNNLVIKIKQQPRSLALKDLVIAIDAGHGGSNTGAGGPTGSSEKHIALALSLQLQKALQQEGARTIMTRSVEKLVENKERILFYRDSLPDLLISLHLNSSGDPIRAGGTSTLYRYIGFRPLSFFINKRILELGLKEYGNIGSFNFMLNSPTEYPNALVETLFISNPEEEMLMMDEAFRAQMAAKIVAGIKDFLQAANK